MICLVGFGILRPSKKKLRPGISPSRRGHYDVNFRVGMRKLFMGRYKSERDAQRAYDVARYYTGNEDGEFYFEDTPTLLSQMRRPIESFKTVSSGDMFQKFRTDLRLIVQEVIRRDNQGTCGISMVIEPDDVLKRNLANIGVENKVIYSVLASASGETLIQVNYFRLAIAN